MTPAAQTTVADLLEALAATVRTAPTIEERVLPMEEVYARLGITRHVFQKRKLHREIPVIVFGAQTKGVREQTLNDFIRRREQLARGGRRGPRLVEQVGGAR